MERDTYTIQIHGYSDTVIKTIIRSSVILTTQAVQKRTKHLYKLYHLNDTLIYPTKASKYCEG